MNNVKKQIESILKQLKGGLRSQNNSGPNVDQESLDRCLDELQKLRQEFEAHRDYAADNLRELNNAMPTKADKSDLIDLENRIMDQLRDAIAQLLN